MFNLVLGALQAGHCVSPGAILHVYKLVTFAQGNGSIDTSFRGTATTEMGSPSRARN